MLLPVIPSLGDGVDGLPFHFSVMIPIASNSIHTNIHSLAISVSLSSVSWVRMSYVVVGSIVTVKIKITSVTAW